MAQAETTPCVSPSFDVPFPGATDVTSYVTDLPSSAFPAFWQEGRLDGYAYKIFANATGVLRGGGADQTWKIDMTCDASVGTCALTQTGTPPEAATRVATRVGQCLAPALSKPAVVENVAPAAAQEPIPEQLAVAPTDQPMGGQADKTCGVALTDEASDIATMQRLLVLLGEEPGPVDGLLGPQSFAAMRAFTDNPGWATSVPDLVAVLDEQHCVRVQSSAGSETNGS